jgi:hypothetical protein
MNFLKLIGYDPWPPWELLSVDLITDERKAGILNLNHLDKFEVKLKGIDRFEGDTLLVLEYHLPKISNTVIGYSSIKKYEGLLFINMKDNAIVKHQLSLSGNVDFELEIIYRKSEEKYFPYYLKGERVNTFKVKGVTRKIKTTNEIIVKATTLENPTRFENEMKLWNPANIPDDQDFWDIYHRYK